MEIKFSLMAIFSHMAKSNNRTAAEGKHVAAATRRRRRGCRKIIKLDVRAAPSFYIMKKSGYNLFVLETFWILGIL